MKVLIAIMSCEAERYMHDVIRETWLRNCPCDYAFILGHEAGSQFADEIRMAYVPDARNALIYKVQATMRYALNSGYDYLFRCDNDTFVAVDRLLASDFAERDLTNGYGGTGIWLNRDCMQALLSYTKPVWSANGLRWETWDSWGFFDDKWIVNAYGQMGRGAPYIDARYSPYAGLSPMPNNNVITYHQDVRNSLRLENRMREIHRLYLEGAWHIEDVPKC